MKQSYELKLKFHFTKLLLAVVFVVGAAASGWGQYDGTGTFTKITSIEELEDGFYVVAELNEEFAMDVDNSGTFFKHTAISPVSDEIFNPANDIVWKIESDGAGYTISNIDGETVIYVSYSGSNNNAFAVENPASVSDNERWTIEYNDRFEVTNVAVDNRELQYNAGAPPFCMLYN